MRFGILISLFVLLFVGTAQAKSCWKKKQIEMNSLKTRLVEKLEAKGLKDWNFSTGNDLYIVEKVVRKTYIKEVHISISDFGLLSVNHSSIPLPDKLQRRISKLYKKIYCLKTTKEILLIKEILGDI